MNKYIIVGMFSFLFGVIVALGISNITQPPATSMAKESIAQSRVKEKSKTNTSNLAPSSSAQSISRLYNLVPPQANYKNLIVARSREAEAYFQENAYKMTSKANTNLNAKSLINEASTELPNPIDPYGEETYLYFWATDAQENTLGSVRTEGRIVFFKATDSYLNSLR